MVEEDSGKEMKTTMIEYFAVFTLATTAFAYYYTMSDVLMEITNIPGMMHIEKLLIMGIFYAGVGISVIAGAFLSNTLIQRNTLLRLWLALAILGSTLSILVEQTTIPNVSVVSLIWGITVGFGMPSCMALFADVTVTEKRGSLGGLLAFTFNASLFGLALLLGSLSPVRRVQYFILWLMLGLAFTFVLRKQIKEPEQMKNPKIWTILHEKTIVLYMIPWIMFCLVNSLEAPIIKSFFGSEFFNFLTVAVLALSSISALVGGFLADRIGRKIVAVIGFASLGVGYASLGLFPTWEISWFLYVIVDGIAWGMFVVVFFTVLWGDLAGDMLKEKYYLVGGLPFLLSWFIQLVIEPYIELISIYAAFSIASFFLFLAVIPLMYAPETLPEKKIKDRELKQYVEKAKKAREEYA